MGYRSKQRLHMRATLYVYVRITDIDGNWTQQNGKGQGIPSTENYAMFESAILNAVYKHRNESGNQYAKGGSYDYKDVTEQLIIEDWFYIYQSESDQYTFKVSNYNTKNSSKKTRYTVIRRKGKIYKRVKYNYQTKDVTDEWGIE